MSKARVPPRTSAAAASGALSDARAGRLRSGPVALPIRLAVGLGLVLIAASCKTENSSEPLPPPTFSGGNGSAPLSERNEIRSLFHRYQEAIKGRDATKLQTCLSHKSLEWLTGIARDAASLGRSDLQSLADRDLQRAYYIVRARLENERRTLQTATPDQLLVHFVANGWFDGDMLPEPLHEIYPGARIAYATILLKENNQEVERFFFEREGAAWKVDLLQPAAVGSKELSALARAANQSPLEFLSARFQRTHRTAWNPAVLDGPIK